jgi:hypothetical protein
MARKSNSQPESGHSSIFPSREAQSSNCLKLSLTLRLLRAPFSTEPSASTVSGGLNHGSPPWPSPDTAHCFTP